MDERQRGLSRERLVEAAVRLVDGGGLEALSMRALADRLDVKAASLYWHVRDRRELVELLAESLLDGVSRPRRAGGWRAAVVASAGALRSAVAAHKDVDRILLEVPDAMLRSGTFLDIAAQLETAGMRRSEAEDVALMVMTHAITGRSPAREPDRVEPGAVASVAIDSGSRGVLLRAGGPDMQTLVEVPPEQSTAAPAVVRGETVVVRRLRGVGLGEIALNPRRPWRIHVKAPTWNTVLDAGLLDVRGIHVDSGAAKIECFLPEPRGVVTIHISGGVANMSIHRPEGAAEVARLGSGAVKVRLDGFATRVTVADVHWQSEGAARQPNRYELEVSGGAVKITMDTYAPKAGRPADQPAPRDGGDQASALDVLLDGVEARVRAC